MSYPYPIKDWTDEGSYPLRNSFDVDPHNQTVEADPFWPAKRWAWEFLRRNAAYQERAVSPQMAEPSAEIQEEFGLPFIISPKDDDPDPVVLGSLTFLRWASAALPDFEGRLTNMAEQSGKHSLIVEFDLRTPLAPQTAKLQALFEAMSGAFTEAGLVRREAKRKRFDRYPLYLRLLDAKASGASNRQIAERLYEADSGESFAFAGHKALDDDLQAARKLVNGGYRAIANG